jgi:hypothetical protein
MIRISVEIGYELRSVELTSQEWEDVQKGTRLNREVVDCYEGEAFRYVFAFNDRKGSTLVVTYDDADGFIGDIGDVLVDASEEFDNPPVRNEGL